MTEFLLLLGLVSLPLCAGLRRGWRVSWLFGLSVLGFVVLWGINTVYLSFLLMSNPALTQDVQSIEAHNERLIWPLVIMAFFGLLYWGLERWRVLAFPRCAAVLFWVLHVGLAASGFLLHMLGHHVGGDQGLGIDGLTLFDNLATFARALSWFALAAAVGLALLAVLSAALLWLRAGTAPGE